MKPFPLLIVVASALAALAVGLGAQTVSDRPAGDLVFASRTLPDLF